MDELKHRVTLLQVSADRIEEKIDRINERTEEHSEHLIGLGALKGDVKRIADGLEKIAERHSGAMLKLALVAIILLGIIAGVVILAYTRTPLSASKDGFHVEVNQ